MILLYAEDNEGKPVDVVFVDSINLDGESNLKPWTIIDSDIKSIQDLWKYKGFVANYDKPNKNLEAWQGNVWTNSKTITGHIDNLLLRGCTLWNTSKAFGVVIYIGKQTKIVKNSKSVPDKLSNIIKKMNKILYSVFLL